MPLPTNLADCHKELQHTRQQLDILTNRNEALQRQIYDLKRALETQHSQLQQDINILSQELEDARNEEQLSLQHELEQVRFYFYHSGERAALIRERDHLLLELEAEKHENQKWKDEAHGNGSAAVRRCWQASVDEAVRKEREKDKWLVRNLFDEIDMLKAEKALLKPTRSIDGEVVELKDSLYVKSLRGEIAMLRAGYMKPDDMRVRRPW